ncbi:MAG: hypothetical protein U0271_33325 [Polyangiaceae bacterium]
MMLHRHSRSVGGFALGLSLLLGAACGAPRGSASGGGGEHAESAASSTAAVSSSGAASSTAASSTAASSTAAASSSGPLSASALASPSTSSRAPTATASTPPAPTVQRHDGQLHYCVVVDNNCNCTQSCADVVDPHNTNPTCGRACPFDRGGEYSLRCGFVEGACVPVSRPPSKGVGEPPDLD